MKLFFLTIDSSIFESSIKNCHGRCSKKQYVISVSIIEGIFIESSSNKNLQTFETKPHITINNALSTETTTGKCKSHELEAAQFEKLGLNVIDKKEEIAKN